MLVFTKGTDGEIVVTLNEKRTLTDGYYLFVFENITTRDQYKKVFAFSEDESSYTTRYNQFTILSSVFNLALPGEYSYTVYESPTSTTDPTGLTEVERGIMQLNPASEFSFETYNGATTYKAYGG